MKFLNEAEELAWVAGLLEGEGHFAYVNNGQGSGTQRVQLRMADEDVVIKAADILSRMIGASIKINERAGYKVNWSPQHDFQLNGENARIVMKKLIRFMSEHRKHQIVTALQGKRMIQKIDLAALGLSAGSSTAADIPKTESVV